MFCFQEESSFIFYSYVYVGVYKLIFQDIDICLLSVLQSYSFILTINLNQIITMHHTSSSLEIF